MVAVSPQLQPVAAARRALEGALLAREGRPRDAGPAYRDALERFERIGMRLQAALAGLDAIEALGPEIPSRRRQPTRSERMSRGPARSCSSGAWRRRLRERPEPEPGLRAGRANDPRRRQSSRTSRRPPSVGR